MWLKGKYMNKETCIRQKLGSCEGCNMIQMIKHDARWHQMSVEGAAKIIKDELCPKGEKPDVTKIRNMWASFGMGQRREELIDFPDQPLNPKGRQYDKRGGMR